MAGSFGLLHGHLNFDELENLSPHTPQFLAVYVGRRLWLLETSLQSSLDCL